MLLFIKIHYVTIYLIMLLFIEIHYVTIYRIMLLILASISIFREADE